MGKTPLAVEQKLLKTIPGEYMQNAHHWLKSPWALIPALARKTPRCETCILNELCYSFHFYLTCGSQPCALATLN